MNEFLVLSDHRMWDWVDVTFKVLQVKVEESSWSCILSFPHPQQSTMSLSNKLSISDVDLKDKKVLIRWVTADQSRLTQVALCLSVYLCLSSTTSSYLFLFHSPFSLLLPLSSWCSSLVLSLFSLHSQCRLQRPNGRRQDHQPSKNHCCTPNYQVCHRTEWVPSFPRVDTTRRHSEVMFGCIGQYSWNHSLDEGREKRKATWYELWGLRRD